MIIIRSMTAADIPAFIELARQLGYEVRTSHVRKMIAENNPFEQVYVASLDERVVGWVDFKINQSYLRESHIEIVGLVVDEKERSKGIGKKLLDEIERYAWNKGFAEIRVRSNVIRKAAHKFYLRNGYCLVKTSNLFEKRNLNPQE